MWPGLEANAHTSCADQFETDISACMCRIHQSSCTLFVGGGGGGVTPQLLLRVPGIHLILFLNIFCACYGRGGRGIIGPVDIGYLTNSVMVFCRA